MKFVRKKNVIIFVYLKKTFLLYFQLISYDGSNWPEERIKKRLFYYFILLCLHHMTFKSHYIENDIKALLNHMKVNTYSSLTQVEIAVFNKCTVCVMVDVVVRLISVCLCLYCSHLSRLTLRQCGWFQPCGNFTRLPGLLSNRPTRNKTR